MSGGTKPAEEKELVTPEPVPPASKYHFPGYHRFLDPEGYPAVAPPWGTLNAINLNTGEYVWKIPLGEYPELAAADQKNSGTENYGGPVVTAGGPGFFLAPHLYRKVLGLRQKTGSFLLVTTPPSARRGTHRTF